MRLQAFWHVAVMGGWREIVAEQSSLLRSVGLRPMIGVAGWPGIDLGATGDVVATGNLRDFEFVTLRPLWLWCREHPGEAVLYMHTKGASRPGDLRTRWRRLMERWVVERWRENVTALGEYDAIGVNYLRSARRHPKGQGQHFSGNFWMARADWVRNLTDPCELRGIVPAPRDRLVAEWWLLSRPGFRARSLCCEGWSLHSPGVMLQATRVPLPASDTHLDTPAVPM